MWTVKGVRGSVPPKCIIKQLPGPDGERLDYLRVLSALGQRLSVPYGGSGEGVFVTECIRQLLRCARVPTDIEKTCCAWCGETENLVHDHDPPQGRNTQPSFVQVLCEECHMQKTAEDCFFDDGWRPWVSVLNPQTHEYFQLAAREKPFVWKSPHGKTQRRVG